MGIKYTITLLFFAIINSNAQTEILNNVSNYMKNKFEYESLLFVSIEEQKMYKIKLGEIVKKYDISSSKYGIGSAEGSNKTPIGLHRIKEKYGTNVPINGRMIGRVFYGQIANIYEDTTSSKTTSVIIPIFTVSSALIDVVIYGISFSSFASLSVAINSCISPTSANASFNCILADVPYDACILLTGEPI